MALRFGKWLKKVRAGMSRETFIRDVLMGRTNAISIMRWEQGQKSQGTCIACGQTTEEAIRSMVSEHQAAAAADERSSA